MDELTNKLDELILVLLEKSWSETNEGRSEAFKEAAVLIEKCREESHEGNSKRA